MGSQRVGHDWTTFTSLQLKNFTGKQATFFIYFRCYQIYLFGYEHYLKMYTISMKAIIINSAFQTKGKKFNFIWTIHFLNYYKF